MTSLWLSEKLPLDLVLLTHDPEKCLMRLVYHPSLVAENSPFLDPDDSVQKQYGSELNP